MFGPGHILFKGDPDIHIRRITLEPQISITCPVCAHPDKDLITTLIVKEGDLYKIAQEYHLDYTDVQEHAQHIEIEDLIPIDCEDNQIDNLQLRLEATNNPADIVYIMTLIMKHRVSPLLKDKSASGLAQIDRINKAIRENANVIAKLREQMREGDARKIEQLQKMVSIYRGVLLSTCPDCQSHLHAKIDMAVKETEAIMKEIDSDQSFEAPEEELPEIPEPLVG